MAWFPAVAGAEGIFALMAASVVSVAKSLALRVAKADTTAWTCTSTAAKVVWVAKSLEFSVPRAVTMAWDSVRTDASVVSVE